MRKNRPEPGPASSEQTGGPTPPTPVTEHTPPSPQAPRVTADRSGKTADAGRAQISFAVSTELRDKARAAFRAASYFEGVGSFGEFLTNAVEAEITRIERAHNGGLPLEPVRENLPSGRAARIG